MCCTFVPPYLLQRVALWAGTRHASDSGKETLPVAVHGFVGRTVETGSRVTAVTS